MSAVPPVNVTQLLSAMNEGDASAAGDLLPLVYDELRRLASSYFRVQRGNHTLQPTALVHEAFLRLVGNEGIEWEGRAHFFAVAAKAMRRTLVDSARRKHADKRGGDWHRVTLAGVGAGSGEQPIDVLALDEALDRLAAENERQARIVELRFYGGLKVEHVAHVLGVSPRTVELDWRLACAWLRLELGEEPRT